MKTLNERKLIREEINRINEILGNKKIILEQAQFFRKVGDDVVDLFNDFVGKASKLKNEEIWSIGGQRIGKEMFETFELLVSDPQIWSILEDADKRMIANIMRSDTTYVNKLWDEFLNEFDDILDSSDDFLLKIARLKEQTGKTTQQILEEMWGEYPDINVYLSSLLYRKVDDSIKVLPEMVQRAKKPNYWVELYNDYEPGFMKFLRQSFIDGNFKKSETLVKELEKELDTISYKLVGEKGVRSKISENLETLVNKLAAMKFSSRQEVERVFKKYLIDNKIVKSTGEGDEFVNSPEIKQLLADKSLSIQKSLWFPVASKWSAWIEVLNLVNPYAYYKLAFQNTDLLASGAKRFANVVLWKDPQGWKEVQRSYLRSGVAGKAIDKLLGLALVNFGIIPILAGVFDTLMENEDIKKIAKDFKALKELCATDGLPPEMCNQLNNLQGEFMTEKDFKDRVLENMPIGFDKGWWNLLAGTYVDDIIKKGYDLTVRLITGGETAEEDFRNSFQGLINSNREALEAAGWDFNKTQDQNMERILSIANERRENQKKIIKSTEGFKAWALVNRYTVVTPYDKETGIGSAYKNSDETETPIDFQFKDGTFKE